MSGENGVYREMLKSKIHRATVTQADLHYVGSVTVDRTLMDKANLLPGEKVDIIDLNNGSRLSTYAIEGAADTGVIGINGGGARLISPGDLVIIIAYASVPDQQAAQFRPSIVFVDDNNRPIELTTDPAHVPAGYGLRRGDVLSSGDPSYAPA
jgi:aspartate 1-decarboxylase